MVMASVAYASWPEYQGGASRTGSINPRAQPPITTPIATSITLPGAAPALGGISVEALLETVNDTTYAYVQYPGGAVVGTGGGTRIAKVNLNTSSIVSGWGNSALGYSTMGGASSFELATPYLDLTKGLIYAGINNMSTSLLSCGIVSVNTGTGAVTSLVVLNNTAQINTPITKYGDCLYFGTYTSTTGNMYYQYDLLTGVVNTFTGARGFYWAGAQIVNINGADYIAFGSDAAVNGNHSYLYLTPAGANFGTHSNDINISNYVTSPGNVRSSISKDDAYIYFTSQGGYLWRGTISTLLNGTPTLNVRTLPSGYSSTSTPTISGNSYIYVGYYSLSGGGGSGGVVAVPQNNFTTGPMVTIYSGDAVQASPIVYNITAGLPTNSKDFIYFTTNTRDGRGYCYSLANPNSPSIAKIWNNTGVSNNSYALQGFASDNGFLVYGDDTRNLYIMK